MARVSELSRAAALLSGGFTTSIQQVNYPFHNGKPNPRHGQFFFVGTIPIECCRTDEHGHIVGSQFYPTEDEAIRAALAAGVTRLQRADCSFVDPTDPAYK